MFVWVELSVKSPPFYGRVGVGEGSVLNPGEDDKCKSSDRLINKSGRVNTRC